MNSNFQANLNLVNDGNQDAYIGIGKVLPRIHPPSWNLKPGGECRSAAYSDDGLFFAWSAGHGYVKIIINQLNKNQNLINDILNQIDPDSEERNHNETWFQKIDCGGSEKVECMKFSNDKYPNHRLDINCHLLAAGLEKGHIKIWHPLTGELIYTLADHTLCVNGISFAPLGVPILISCSNDKTLKIWDMSDLGNMTLTVKEHTLPVLDCEINPVNSQMVCSVGKSRQAFIWKLEEGKRRYKHVHHLKGHNNDVVACSFSYDGALLATASYDTFVFVWDPYQGVILHKLGHMNPVPPAIYSGGANGCWVKSVCFAKDNQRIATVCEDDRVRIWPLFENAPILTCELTSPGNQCLFSPDGSQVAVGNDNGTVSLINNVGGNVSSLCHLSRMSARRLFVESSFIRSSNLPQYIQNFLLYQC